MKRVAAGAHLPNPWLFESVKRPDDKADYIAWAQSGESIDDRALNFTRKWNTYSLTCVCAETIRLLISVLESHRILTAFERRQPTLWWRYSPKKFSETNSTQIICGICQRILDVQQKSRVDLVHVWNLIALQFCFPRLGCASTNDVLWTDKRLFQYLLSEQMNFAPLLICDVRPTIVSSVANLVPNIYFDLDISRHISLIEWTSESGRTLNEESLIHEGRIIDSWMRIIDQWMTDCRLNNAWSLTHEKRLLTNERRIVDSWKKDCWLMKEILLERLLTHDRKIVDSWNKDFWLMKERLLTHERSIVDSWMKDRWLMNEK